MDDRMKKLVGMLREKGYTDRYVEEHWGEQWKKRRWFDVEMAADNSILQIITANQYTRINLTRPNSARPFAFMRYVSWDHAVFPKCAFRRHQETRKTMRHIVSVVEKLATFGDAQFVSIVRRVATFSMEEI
jgi:hypothetical protein